MICPNIHYIATIKYIDIRTQTMDIQHLLYFEKHDATSLYMTVVNDLGQIFYCEADEEKQPNGKWKEINLDLHALSVLH